MNTERLNYQLDELKSLIDSVREKNADDLRKADIVKISARYERLYGAIKAQLAFIGQTWTILLQDKDGFLTSVQGKSLTEADAEKYARIAIDESPEAVEALLFCDGIHVRTI